MASQNLKIELLLVKGIMMVKDSRVNFIGNRIYKNESVGIFIRDKCKGTVKDNEVI